MRWMNAIVQPVAGVVLVGAVQWAARGAPGLPLAVPGRLAPAVPLAAFLLFGLFLAAVYGRSPGVGPGVLGALVALAVAAVPFAYAYGLAQRYGLPAGAGAAGALLAGPLARGAAATWFAVALIQSLRPAATRARIPGAVPATRADLPAAEPAGFWSPAPALQVGEPAAVAYTPEESERP